MLMGAPKFSIKARAEVTGPQGCRWADFVAWGHLALHRVLLGPATPSMGLSFLLRSSVVGVRLNHL